MKATGAGGSHPIYAALSARLRQLLLEATVEPRGLLLQTSDLGRAERMLAKLRYQADEVEVKRLQIRKSPGVGLLADGDLIICKRQVTVGDQAK